MHKLYFFVGPALILSALILSALGLRNDNFPPKRLMAVVLPVFAALVVSVMVFSVIHENHDSLGAENRAAAKTLVTRDQEAGVQLADEPGGPAANVPTASAGAAAPPAAQAAAPSGKGTTLSVTSPASGALSYSPSTLTAKAGQVTIDYKNPSPVPHSIAIAPAAQSDKPLDQTQPGPMTSFSVSANLKPGKYVYYCTVPGHREAGMQGTLTVK